MRTNLFILFLLVILVGCSTKADDIIYIKVFTQDRTDSKTAYNKGLTINHYLYYNPSKDSAVYRSVQNWEPLEYQTVIGKFENSHYRDTLLSLVKFLRHYRDGPLPEPGPEAPMINSAIFYVEFKDAHGVHYKNFISDNDTLLQFSDFFHGLTRRLWQRQVVRNSIINWDKEMVDVMKGVGNYEKTKTPYIPLPCEKGINLEHLYGRWRTRGGKYDDALLDYWINSIDKDGSWRIERVRNGISKLGYVGKIIEISKDYTIKVKGEKGIATLKILNLTKNCFEYRYENNYVWQFDRMD